MRKSLKQQEKLEARAIDLQKWWQPGLERLFYNEDRNNDGRVETYFRDPETHAEYKVQRDPRTKRLIFKEYKK